MRFEELRCREIINISTGHRLGYVSDAELDLVNGCVRALIVPGPARFFGLFGREPDFLIPIDCVKKMGQDILLVEVNGGYKRSKRNRTAYF
ncbi:MAG: YlmC/YmxH family sporulation protein [Oscillospiraceae bacterium]|nr:YlmC/YmxH family sporulation protein [Oscillospiraceae bacterium]MBR3861155.1 YlmC/YmxH family sporulation protein [Oscillospiraceae bacterium]MBR6096279.1 YlmC/YmxH family sporulation protein [Oscillospiraceae bacterium]MBR7056442.1 YlmC/YmxH family sporulation protein [Oscillospiraceae bacterium]